MEDTIAAIATPIGEGGIGIIRISGPQSAVILEKIFSPVSGKISFDRRMMYGNIVNPENGKVLDEVMCLFMSKPKTYTAEDVVEINCHGGMVPLKNVLQLTLKYGARLAERGEFTKRAFLNGRLDLSQAEAVIDVVRAKTDKSFDVALDQLDGSFSRHIQSIRKQILDTLVNITVNIDYPDEDIEVMTYGKLNSDLQNIYEQLSILLRNSETGRIVSQGLNIAIVGKPNVGKSSLMNCLLNEDRAIVTEVPGTTRDTISESVSIAGIPVNLIDTAGIRATDDKIEKIGIEKSKQSFNKADMVFLVLDGSNPLTDDDFDIIKNINSDRTLVLINKVDLPRAFSELDIKKILPDTTIVETSMHTGVGIHEISSLVEQYVYNGSVSFDDEIFVTNLRHKELIEKAFNSIHDSLKIVSQHEPLEIIEIDVNSAYDDLGEIIGETVNDDILNEVFSKFCLGK